MIGTILSMGVGVWIISRTRFGRKNKPASDTSPRPVAYEELRPQSRAAVFLMSISPEASAQCFKSLEPAEVQTITQCISQLPQITQEVRARVTGEFVGAAHSIIGVQGASPSANSAAVLDGLAKDSPELVVRLLRALWLP